jgi:succinoglycan biosynthesis protein ExoA
MAHRVSVIVPAREEERFIEACVRSIRSQEADAELEVIVADGASSDRTAERARAAGAKVVPNPQRVIPSALNHGLAAATGDVVIRFDAHSEMPPGYVAACLLALDEEEGAGTVGGWCQVRASGPWGRALGEALASPVGIGYAMRWRRPAPGTPRTDVDTVHFGCYRRALLVELGGWDEQILTNEDFELDFRLRKMGHRVIFDPAVWATYRPRESLPAIVGQYARYGRWKAEMLAGAPESIRPRQLAPPGLLITIVAALVPWPLARLARGGLAAYALIVGGAAARSDSGWRLGVLLPAMHLAWGLGLMARLPVAALRRLSAAGRTHSGRTGSGASAGGPA